MRLKLEELQRVVKNTIIEEKSVDALRAEIRRSFGPSVITEATIELIAKSANDYLHYLNTYDKKHDFKPAVALKFVNHPSPEVRKFVVNVLPSNLVERFLNDKSDVVRAAAAKRAPLKLVAEAANFRPDDHLLNEVYETRLIEEADDMPFETMSSDGKKLGAVAKQQEVQSLSDQWYEQAAQKLVQDYGRNIDENWEETAVKRYVSSVRATSHVQIDAKKLLQNVYDILEDREELALEKSTLKETVNYLRQRDFLETPTLKVSFDDSIKPENQILSTVNEQSFLKNVMDYYQVTTRPIEEFFSKNLLNEIVADKVEVPVEGTLSRTMNVTDEKVLDAFVNRWNKKQKFAENFVKLSWSVSGDKITFEVEEA